MGNVLFWLYSQFCYPADVNTNEKNLYEMYSHNEAVGGVKLI